jgi:hypothetical protein
MCIVEAQCDAPSSYIGHFQSRREQSHAIEVIAGVVTYLMVVDLKFG